MFICVLTVLGLVRFLASVSQLLRWLYVLLLHDIDRGTQVTMTTGKDLTLTFLRRDRKNVCSCYIVRMGVTMRAAQHNLGVDICVVSCR